MIPADALHCQREHITYLAQRGAHWILTVKGNQCATRRSDRLVHHQQTHPTHFHRRRRHPRRRHRPPHRPHRNSRPHPHQRRNSCRGRQP
ncbi:hypothetical protein [Micromonospora inaquosa]|uniref:hypothetical protein n=1 Tax=Micromonospora inaquosa TaxID=2203716 RepID=UPI003CC666AA